MRTAIALSVLLIPVAAGAAGPLPDGPHIYVEGHHTQTVEADRFSIRVSLGEVAATSSSAATSVSSRVARLLAKAEALGVPEDAIRAFQIRVAPEYEWHGSKHQIVGTRVTREIEFTLENLDLMQGLFDLLIASDIAEIHSAQVSSSREEAIRQSVVEAAVLHARSRAERIAKPLGAQLGDVHSVSEFEGHYRPTELTEFVRYRRSLGLGAASFKPGPVDVTGRVYVVFLLKD